MIIIENDTDKEIISANRRFISYFKDSRIDFIHYTWDEKGFPKIPPKPWSIGRSRQFLYSKIRELGIVPSVFSPIWILDDDFIFKTVIPDKMHGWSIRKISSTFHKLEILCNSLEVDALIGGNCGAPPVPVLSTILRQLKDINYQFFENKLPMYDQEETIDYISKWNDYYYDISRDKIPDTNISIKSTWWRNNNDRILLDHNGNSDIIIEMLGRLISGLPVTRPTVDLIKNDSFTSWEIHNHVKIAGGNVIIMSDEALNPKWLLQIKYDNLVSRRADTNWCILAQHNGLKIFYANVTLNHSREPRIKNTKDCVFLKKYFLEEMTKDALGVGLYEAILELRDLRDKTKLKEISKFKIRERISLVNNHLNELENTVRSIKKQSNDSDKFDSVFNSVYWKIIEEISKERIYVDFDKIETIHPNDFDFQKVIVMP